MCSTGGSHSVLMVLRYGRSIVGRYCILVFKLLDSDSDASAVLRLPVYSPVIDHNFFY